MICIFEDHENTLLSTFVRAAIPKQIKCFYSDGVKKIKAMLQSVHDAYPEEFVTVYCDLIPNNFETKTTFEGLWHMTAENNSMHGKVFVAPSLCTEYYYLRSLHKYGLIDKEYRDIVDLCLTREPYLLDDRLSAWDRSESTTHERFCKLMCRVAVKNCANTASKGSHYYMLHDCLCEANVAPECTELTVYEKSCRVANEWMFRVDGWGCAPSGLDLSGAIEELIQIAENHNKLAERYERATSEKMRKSAKINIKTLRRLIYASFQNCQREVQD